MRRLGIIGGAGRQSGPSLVISSSWWWCCYTRMITTVGHMSSRGIIGSSGWQITWLIAAAWNMTASWIIGGTWGYSSILLSMILGGRYWLMHIAAIGSSIIVIIIIRWWCLMHIGTSTASRISGRVRRRRTLRHIPTRSGCSIARCWPIRLRIVVGVTQFGHISVGVAAAIVVVVIVMRVVAWLSHLT